MEVEILEPLGIGNHIIDAVKTVSKAINKLHEEILTYKSTKSAIREQSDLLQELNSTLLNDLVLKNLEVVLDVGDSDEGLLVGGQKIPTVKRNKLEPCKRMRYFCDRCSQELDQEEEERKSIRASLKDALGYEAGEYLEFIYKIWPEKTFEKSKETVGNPLSSKEGDVILFLKEKIEDTTLVILVKNRYPEIEEILSVENGDDLSIIIWSAQLVLKSQLGSVEFT